MPIDAWLEDKYGGGGPGSDRFKKDPSEVHASKTSTCPRKYWFDFHINRESGASPYFELGRMFERAYGRALAWQYGDPDTLRSLEPHEVVDAVSRVKQDIEITIELSDELRIVGESDWVVLAEGAPDIDEVVLTKDGDHRARAGREVKEYDPDWVEKVVETKTIKNTRWVRLEGKDGHYYQLMCYLHCMDTDGELVYVQRDNLDYIVHEVEYDPNLWMDIELRARNHHRNVLDEDTVPDTNPINERECKYCSYQAECIKAGDSPPWV